MRARDRDRFLRAGAAALGALVVAALALFTGITDLYEAKTLDWRFRLLSRPERADSNIVLVLVDQRSLDFWEQEGLEWPWPREIYQLVVEYCRTSGARGIAFDIVFTEPSWYGASDDERFAQAMSGFGAAVLGVPLTGKSQDAVLPEKMFLEGARASRGVPSYTGAQVPVAALVDSAARLGNVTYDPDDDGTYRSMAHVVRCGDRLVPSLPLALLLAADPTENVTIGADGSVLVRGSRVPTDERGNTALCFWGPVSSYRCVPIAAVITSYNQQREGLEPEIAPQELDGKFVLVGLSAPGLYDLRPIPLGGAYPGVAIHATALDNLLNDDFLRRVPGWLTMLAAATAGIVVAFLASAVRRLWLVGLAFLVVLALVLGASFALFRMLWWLQLVPLMVAVSVSFLGTVLANFAAERKEKRFLRTAFSHYLNPGMVEEIVRNPSLLKLGGERREMTVHFSDIAGFTTIAEGMEPSELTEMLNTYLSEMTDIILESGGTLDKYEGDAIIAFWGAPLHQPDHALRACRAVLACRARLEQLVAEFGDHGWPPLRVRIGVSSGPMVVGNMGSHSRFDYTVIGDNVNLAARLEGANKVFGTDVLLSEDTHRLVEDEIVCREVAALRVKGKHRAVKVYQPLGAGGDVPDDLHERVQDYESALARFRDRQWRSAAELFSRLGEDPLAQWYERQCAVFESNAPGPEWDGVVSLETK